MNRNVESHFSNLPHVDIQRSQFDRSSTLKTSFNVGDIVPFYVDEVLPGDTFNVKTSKVVRMQTLKTPMMDNIYLDTYFFFVPNRLVWEHWKQFNGENTESAWYPTTEYAIPQLEAPEGGFSVGTIADYMGIPTGVENISVTALPFRAYALICNEWFRDQNLTDPLLVPTDDSNVTGVNTGNYITDVAKGGLPFVASKYHDYFTSALPSPQKGPDVTIPVGQGSNFPVVPLAEKVDDSLLTNNYTAKVTGSSANGMNLLVFDNSGVQKSGTAALNTAAGIPVINNLWAIDDGLASMATINQLRLAFQIQKLYEKDARGGSRYTEILRTHFGVTSPDSRLQRPEYLGGNRIPISISQVVQQSGTESTGTPQGTTAGMSVTTDTNDDFIKSFTEHGYVIGVMVARYDHTYQQGIERMWSRKTRFDYYWPVFANIGEQAVLNKEIFASGSDSDDEVFGYQEAWADYRYKPNRVSGMMRSQYPQSLDVWHLADDYETMPYLSDGWIREDKNTVNRILTVSSDLSNQLFADIYIKNVATRPMPMYSIPGLIDHF